MTTSTIDIDATPEEVWAVLSDPTAYPRWLVGAKRIRAADPRFPAPGTSFDHAVGAGPVEVADSTSAVAAEAPYHLELEVRARPMAVGRVVFDIEHSGQGCSVRFFEHATGGVAGLLRPLADALAKPRNDASLRQLKALVEGI